MHRRLGTPGFGRALVAGAIALATANVAIGAASAEPWTRRYVNSLPDSAFATVETDANGKEIRHLPHHNRRGAVDLPHVRNALSRLPHVQWVDPSRATAAREHLQQHLHDAH